MDTVIDILHFARGVLIGLGLVMTWFALCGVLQNRRILQQMVLLQAQIVKLLRAQSAATKKDLGKTMLEIDARIERLRKVGKKGNNYGKKRTLHY